MEDVETALSSPIPGKIGISENNGKAPIYGNISYLRRNMDRYVEFPNANKGIIFGPYLVAPSEK